MALKRQLCVPTPGHCGGPGLGILGFQQLQLSHAPSPPFSGPQFPHVYRVGAQVPNLSGSRAGAYADPTPPCRQLGPRSPGSCTGTSQVGCPAHLPGNQLQARPAHLAGHTPLLTQQPACGRGQRVVGDRQRRSALGSQVSISGGQRPLLGGCQALADKGPGGRMNHQALSASFIPAGLRARAQGCP